MQVMKTTFTALLAVIVTVGALWFTNRAVTPKVATWEDVQAEARSGGYRIITTEDLAGLYREDPEAQTLVFLWRRPLWSAKKCWRKNPTSQRKSWSSPSKEHWEPQGNEGFDLWEMKQRSQWPTLHGERKSARPAIVR